MRSTIFLFSTLLTSVLATPFPAFEKRTNASLCGQWDNVVAGTYTLYNNLWDMAAATSGSQCTTLISSTGNTLAWSTSWSWAGASSSVKSFANVVYKPKSDLQLSSIKSIPSVFKYTYTGDNIVADGRSFCRILFVVKCWTRVSV